MKKTVVKLTIICQFHSCVCNGNWRMWRRTHHFKKLVYVGTKDVCMQLWPNGESIRLLRWNAGIPELRSHHQPRLLLSVCELFGKTAAPAMVSKVQENSQTKLHFKNGLVHCCVAPLGNCSSVHLPCNSLYGFSLMASTHPRKPFLLR